MGVFKLKMYCILALIISLLIFSIYNEKSTHLIVISDDVRGDLEKNKDIYFITQLNKYDFMPLADDDLFDNSLKSSKIIVDNIEDINLSIIK